MSGGVVRPSRAFALLLGLASIATVAAPALGSPPLPGADPVRSLVQSALEHNPSLLAQREKVRAAGQVSSQARALPDPMAEVEFMNLSVTRPDLKDALTEGISLGVTQVLPYPGKRGAAEKVALAEVEVERARLTVMERELGAQVAAAAYRLAVLEELLALNDRSREAMEAASQASAAVYAAGMGSPSEVLLAQSATTRALARREELETQRNIVTDRLESLAGGSVEADDLGGFILPEPVPLPPLADLLARLPDSAPEVLAGLAEEAVGEQKVQAARLSSKPDFSLGARYRFRDMSMGGDDYLTATFGMTLPFFHRKDRYRPALQQAASLRESARYATAQSLSQSRYRLSEAHRSADSSLRLYRLYREGLLIQAEQAYASSAAAYSVGKSDLASLLMALTQLYEIQADEATARGDYQEARATMEALLGELPRDARESGSAEVPQGHDVHGPDRDEATIPPLHPLP